MQIWEGAHQNNNIYKKCTPQYEGLLLRGNVNFFVERHRAKGGNLINKSRGRKSTYKKMYQIKGILWQVYCSISQTWVKLCEHCESAFVWVVCDGLDNIRR